MKKTLIIILLLGLSALLGFYYLQQTKDELADNTRLFFAAAVIGSEQAQDYLAPNIENKEALLTALQTEALITKAEIRQVRLHSYKRASVLVDLEINKKVTSLEAQFIREGRTWRINSLPAFTVLEQALISNLDADQVTLFTTQGKHTFVIQADDAVQSGNIGDAVAIERNLIYFKAYAAEETAKLLAITSDALEVEMSGLHPLAADVVYFQPQQNSFRLVDKQSLLVGMEDLTLYWQDNEVKAVMLPENFLPTNIRVLLNTTGFTSISHRQVTLSANTSYLLTDKAAKQQYRFTSGQKLSFKPTDNGIEATFPDSRKQSFPNRLYLIPDHHGQLRVETLKRGTPAFTPTYHGHLEIKAAQGALLLVNEVPLETYLYSVVPSEMPISFGAVPLQVQAVAARTYAVAAMYRGGFKQYGAHVDDSVSSQVYNNVPEYAASTAAVNHTQGVIVKYQDTIADTRFFSTSAGVTANKNEVWHDEASGSFPGTAVPYLRALSQLRTGQLPDVTSEAGAREFFTQSNRDSYDQNSPWFRWQVEMTAAELTAVLKQYLPERYRAQPDFVLTKAGDDFVSKEVAAEPLGKLTDLRVIRRGAGGNILELELVGEKGTYRLLKEYTIRFTLRPISMGSGKDVILTRHDGSTLANYTILPSTFMVFEVKRDSSNNITSILFQGGGNGHGVGLSQWGSRGLAEDGRSFSEILQHYYPGCTLTNIY
ncbi:MAG TPA: SpoIID/LytB domain-containing protein [Oscillospiraceae bacterium]|nr:SpoIID/LytB domain-containing protein [Oscillospiraceae bacterium]